MASYMIIERKDSHPKVKRDGKPNHVATLEADENGKFEIPAGLIIGKDTTVRFSDNPN